MDNIEMDNIEFIENYFKGVSNEDQKVQFEKKIMEDASFAEDVAFYISANGVIKQQLHEERKQRFKDLYQQPSVVSIKTPVRQIWKYLAAASIIIALGLFTWFYYAGKTSPLQLADKYVQKNFTTLGVTMGNRDSLQNGLDLFNSGKLPAALAIFETLAKKDPLNTDAKKYAGIVSLRLHNYDKALEYFTTLEANSTLFSNPGKFYKAITLLARNKNGDKEAAKLLLHQVIDNGLEGNSEAEEWLKEIK